MESYKSKFVKPEEIHVKCVERQVTPNASGLVFQAFRGDYLVAEAMASQA